VVLANNQWPGAHALQEVRAAHLIGHVNEVATQLPLAVHSLQQSLELMNMSRTASEVTNGQGAAKILRVMGVFND
jgi:hypothetical protein